MDESKAKILVVEDERVVAKELRHRLQALGYSVPATASYTYHRVGRAMVGIPEADYLRCSPVKLCKFDCYFVCLGSAIPEESLAEIARSYLR